MDLIHKKKENRAQIFQSFDSLKGFKEMIQECEVEIVSPRILSQDDYEILNKRVHEIQKGKLVTIEYYDRINYKRITVSIILIIYIKFNNIFINPSKII